MALKFCKFFRLSLVPHQSTSMLGDMNHPSEATLDWGVYLSFHPVMCTCEEIKMCQLNNEVYQSLKKGSECRLKRFSPLPLVIQFAVFNLKELQEKPHFRVGPILGEIQRKECLNRELGRSKSLYQRSVEVSSLLATFLKSHTYILKLHIYTHAS